MEGWISLHRKLQDNWMWKEKREFSKAEAWIDILLFVNHKEGRVIIKNKVYNVKRGDSVVSVKTWSLRWNWTRGRAKRFLDLLQEQKMIEFKSDNKTTHLTVCNYDSYQIKHTPNEHQTDTKQTPNRHQIDTNNNDNNNNNDNKIKIKASKIEEFRGDLMNEVQQKNIIAKAERDVNNRGGNWNCKYNFNPYTVLKQKFESFKVLTTQFNWSFNDVNHMKNSFYNFVIEYWELNTDIIENKMKQKRREYRKK